MNSLHSNVSNVANCQLSSVMIYTMQWNSTCTRFVCVCVWHNESDISLHLLHLNVGHSSSANFNIFTKTVYRNCMVNINGSKHFQNCIHQHFNVVNGFFFRFAPIIIHQPNMDLATKIVQNWKKKNKWPKPNKFPPTILLLLLLSTLKQESPHRPS